MSSAEDVGGPYDVAILGAGPNGLTAAAYLARAGARVIVLERRFERGGTLASDDYSTPFLYNQAQLLLPAGEELPPYHDLELARHSVAFIAPRVAFAVTIDGETLAVRRGGRGLGDALERHLLAASALATELWYRPGSTAGELVRTSPELEALGRGTPRMLSSAAADAAGALIVRYACGLLGFHDPDRPLGAIAACALARLFEPVLVAGGSKSLANALFRVAAGAGARCLVSAPVVAIEPARAGVQVRLADARRVQAASVISTLDLRTTFGSLLGPRAGAELRTVAERWQLDPFGPFTAHFGVKGEPPAAPGTGSDEAAVRVVGFSSAEQVTAHLQAVAAGEFPARPAGHLTVTTRHDPLQASPGPYGPLHTLRFETPAPYRHPDGDWNRMRVRYRQACWELLCAELPELTRTQLLFQFADSPRDLEQRFLTTRNGSVRQGALYPEQTLSSRPDPSCLDGHTPIDGVFLGGGSSHPGVPGTLAAGYHAAGAVCAALGIRRWWDAGAPMTVS